MVLWCYYVTQGRRRWQQQRVAATCCGVRRTWIALVVYCGSLPVGDADPDVGKERGDGGLLVIVGGVGRCQV